VTPISSHKPHFENLMCVCILAVSWLTERNLNIIHVV